MQKIAVKFHSFSLQKTWIHKEFICLSDISLGFQLKD